MTLPELRIGDPVMDAAQGRPMVVTETPQQCVAEWSEANDYDLTENYGNAKFGAQPDEDVVKAVYVSDVRSEPSKDYTFPRSRLRLIDAHHADDGRRVYDRVTVDVLAKLFACVRSPSQNGSDEDLAALAATAGLPEEVVDEAFELATVEQVVGGDDGGE